MKSAKLLGLVLTALLMAIPPSVDGQSRKPGSGSSSRPSSGSSSRPSSGSSSRPSGGSSSRPSSGPKYSAPSRPSPAPKYSAPKTSPQPKSNPSPKYSAPPRTNPNPPSKPKYTAPPSKPGFSSPSNGGSKPPSNSNGFSSPTKPAPNNSSVAGSSKPISGTTSDKARAAREQSSQRKFEESKTAGTSAKPKYSAPTTLNKTTNTNININTRQVDYIRRQPASSYRPEVRQRNISVFVNTHYSRPYDYYCHQPVIYVGGGYSSAFWWMMAEWDAERRARWLYHNRYQIEHNAYERGVRDAEVQAYIHKLEQENAQRDPNYVDRDFTQDPSLMYTDEHVNAVYNSTSTDPNAARTVMYILGSVILIALAGCGVYWICFKARFGS